MGTTNAIALIAAMVAIVVMFWIADAEQRKQLLTFLGYIVTFLVGGKVGSFAKAWFF